MNIAIVHDYIKDYGGAERVLEALHELFPDAPVYTSIYAPNYLGPHKSRFEGWDIRTSFLQKIPFAPKLISPFRIVAPYAFSKMDLTMYDLIIVSATGAYSPNTISKKNARQICYCHTPPRYLYGYPTARKPLEILKPIIHIMNHFLRVVDFESAQNVDLFIANSEETKERIQKFYRKDATVIYPPVEISQEKSGARSKRGRFYYLAGGRLARAKRVDIAVTACTELGIPLKVFGKSFAGYGDELREMAGSTVEFVGEVTDREKWELMRNAKAYIFPSEFEDFGITPVEAMSSGTPVIAFRSGGVQETVVEGKTGVFFDDPQVESLKKAIKKFEKMELKAVDCKRQAEKFGKKRFQDEILKIVEGLKK